MTWQRLVKRNGLEDGDYADPGRGWRANVNVSATVDHVPDISALRRGELEHFEQRAANLAGDVRRLERDARDERTVAETIARRTGIDVDRVAGVLKEFFAL